MIGLVTHVRNMNLWFNGCRYWGYLGRVLVIEKIVHPEMPVIGWLATTEDIRNGSEYMMKLKRARL